MNFCYIVNVYVQKLIYKERNILYPHVLYTSQVFDGLKWLETTNQTRQGPLEMFKVAERTATGPWGSRIFDGKPTLASSGFSACDMRGICNRFFDMIRRLDRSTCLILDVGTRAATQ